MLDPERGTVDWVADGAASFARIALARLSVIFRDRPMPRMVGLAFLGGLQEDPMARTVADVVPAAAASSDGRTKICPD